MAKKQSTRKRKTGSRVSSTVKKITKGMGYRLPHGYEVKHIVVVGKKKATRKKSAKRSKR